MSVAIVVGVVALSLAVVLFGFVQAYGLERKAQLTTDMASVIGSHGIWVGAWLVAIPEGAAAKVRRESARLGSPEVATLWRQVEARVISHVRGPDVITTQEAQGWLEYISKHTEGQTALAPFGLKKQSLFVLVYAATSPPPASSTDLADLHTFMDMPEVIGAKLVALRAARDRGRIVWIMMGLTSFTALLAASAFLVLSVGHAPEADTRTDPKSQPSSPIQAPTSVTTTPSSSAVAPSGAFGQSSSAASPASSPPPKNKPSPTKRGP